jgi:predicted ATPase
MLTEVRLRNFRGFSDHTLPLRPVTLVVGRNNAGKSSLVEALRLLSIVTTRFRALGYHEAKWGGIPKREPGVTPSLKGIAVNFATLFHRYNDPPAIIDAAFANKTAVRIYIGSEERVHAVIFDSKGRAIKTKAGALGLDLPAVEILPQVGPLDMTEEVLNVDYVRRVASSNLAPRHFRNQLKVFPDVVPLFRTLVEQTWPGLRVLDLDAGAGYPGEPLSLIVRDEDFAAEVSAMGHGLQMWLQTMWFLARVQNASAVILDEPDVYMHPDLQRRLVRYLTTRHQQVIVATHSIEMMAEGQPENILIVDRKRPKSHFASDMPAVQRLIENVGSVHNIQLAKLWSAKKCLLVEGKDVRLLSIVHQTLFEGEALESIPHLPLGGWGGWAYAIGSSMLLRNAGGDAIAVYCVLDSDYHSESTIAKRRLEAAQQSVRLHIWSRKEIENYFLVPAAIVRSISKRMPARAQAPSEAEVVTVLTAIAERVKEDAFDAISQELLAENRSLGAGGANKEARKIIQMRWTNPIDGLNVVSGKHLFSQLSAWSQSQFGASLSPTIVAHELRASEVMTEMRTFLEAIEAGRQLPT